MVMRPRDKFQKENWFVESWEWRALGRASLAEVLPYCESTPLILHSPTDRVAPGVLEQMPFEQWKSLQLVRAKTAFEPDGWKQGEWRARFEDGSSNSLLLKVTDTNIESRLNAGEELDGDCLLTISLTAPWAPEDESQPERCYKLAAGVIKL
jgi:hypothetical protein